MKRFAAILLSIFTVFALTACQPTPEAAVVMRKDFDILIERAAGSNARYEIERLLDAKVNLQLWVKVKKDWRDSDFLIKNFGYRKDEM